jgi:hypothetical protein
MCKLSQPIYKPFLQQSTLFSLTSLISLQTKLYQTERSLSESWRARSKTRSGFDVASVTAFQPWANYRVLTLVFIYFSSCMSSKRSGYKKLGLEPVKPLQDRSRQARKQPMGDENKDDGARYPFKMLLEESLA